MIILYSQTLSSGLSLDYLLKGVMIAIFNLIQKNMQRDDNRRLRLQLQKKESFYQQMQKISRKYFQFEQQVYYCPIKDINPQMIVKVQSLNDKNVKKKREEFYIINGQYQPKGQKSFEKLILQIVQTIPRPKSAFGMIYINTFADGQAYNDFKKVLQLLPSEYLLHLTKIYVLQASFFNKAFSWLSFGTALNYIKNKTVNIDSLRQLSQQSHLDLQYLKKILPLNVINSIAKEDQSEQQLKYNFMNNPNVCPELPRSKSEQEPYDKKQVLKKQFISPSQIRGTVANKTTKEKQIDSYEIGPTGAPIILEMLIYFFNNKEEYLKSEGLFRKSVSIDDQTQILHQLNNKNYNYLQSISNPHIIANAIKRFISSFREPVITFKVFDLLMNKDSDPQFNKIVVQNIKQLPKLNKMILFLLLDFLKNSVLQYEQFNKMSLNNLCIVFGPCLMRAEVPSIKQLIYAKKTIVVTNIIFSHFQQIYGDKLSQMKLKRNSYKQYRISQNKQRSSKKSEPQKSPQSNEINEQQMPTTPTFNLLYRTSQFIKQSLQRDESEDQEQQVKIQKQQKIQIINDDKSEQNEKKSVYINLFKSNQESPQFKNTLEQTKKLQTVEIGEKHK